jgi:4-hydroxyphenylpyruvate dioxygenase
MITMDHNAASDNPLGIAGIEFIEYATTEPLAFGALLEQMGFIAIARHRSREVSLYRQGDMNIVVNADLNARPSAARDDLPATVISAVALRVRDADIAYRHAVSMGAWAIQTRVGVMELNIPGVHGAGDSILYFVDRIGDFSIYDVDFKPIPGVPQHPPALAGMHFFGLAQSIHEGRRPEWIDFYQQLMQFEVLPEDQFFGAVHKGILLAGPCRSFYWQLIDPPPGAGGLQWDEQLVRIGFGVPDVPAAVDALQQRGIVFLDRSLAGDDVKGALTRLYKGGVSFELVASDRGAGGAAAA